MKFKIILFILVFIILNGCFEEDKECLQSEKIIKIESYTITNELLIIKEDEKTIEMWNLNNFYRLKIMKTVITIEFIKGHVGLWRNLIFENEIELNEFLNYFIEKFNNENNN